MSDCKNVVYKITNKLNGKSYIGLTTKGANVRWKGHLSILKNVNKAVTKFQKAIIKYDQSVWIRSVLFTTDDSNELCDMEKYYVGLYNTFKCGYNSTTGGEVGYIMSEDSKLKMSLRMTGWGTYKHKDTSDTIKLKTDDPLVLNGTYVGINKGNQVTLGTTRTDEQKKNISDAVKKYRTSVLLEESNNFIGYYLTPLGRFARREEGLSVLNIGAPLFDRYCKTDIMCEKLQVADEQWVNSDILGIKTYDECGWSYSTYKPIKPIKTPFGEFSTYKEASDATGMCLAAISKRCGSDNLKPIKQFMSVNNAWMTKDDVGKCPRDLGWSRNESEDCRVKVDYVYHTPLGDFNSLTEGYEEIGIPEKKINSYCRNNQRFVNFLEVYDENWANTGVLNKTLKDSGWGFETNI